MKYWDIEWHTEKLTQPYGNIAMGWFVLLISDGMISDFYLTFL